MPDNCAGCKFWQQKQYREMDAPEKSAGDCRRHAPVYLRTKMINGDVPYSGPYRYADFPETLGTDWCGDFSAR